MRVNVAKSSGFCFGVRRAIDMSLSLSENKKPVHVLGDIVHNSFVVDKLSEKGIKKVRSIRPAKKGTILIISAHGAATKVFDKAKKCGYKVADATCPKVKAIYSIAKKLEREKNRIIIIGDKGHEEVKGIAGQMETKPLTIESPSDVSHLKLRPSEKYAVITQSTQSIDNIDRIMVELKKMIPDVKLYNTTCRTTTVKQEEIRSLPKENEVVLIVGSSTSANTKRLYQISKTINSRTYWIESARDIQKGWLHNVKSVGIMAGASTPDEIVNEIVENLHQ